MCWPARSTSDDAVRELTLRAATALGVGTEADIRDYFRLAAGQAKPAIAKLVADGELEQVDVDGWSAPAYLVAGQTMPRRDRGTALLCPFDPLIFFRPRVQRLFEFHYRIEIYTPGSPSASTATTSGRCCWTVELVGAGRPQGRPRRGRAARRGRVRRAGPLAARGWPRRWPASWQRWRRGWAWPA